MVAPPPADISLLCHREANGWLGATVRAWKSGRQAAWAQCAPWPACLDQNWGSQRAAASSEELPLGGGGAWTVGALGLLLPRGHGLQRLQRGPPGGRCRHVGRQGGRRGRGGWGDLQDGNNIGERVALAVPYTDWRCMACVLHACKSFTERWRAARPYLGRVLHD